MSVLHTYGNECVVEPLTQDYQFYRIKQFDRRNHSFIISYLMSPANYDYHCELIIVELR